MNKQCRDMRIYLVDIDGRMIKAWESFFSNEENIVIANRDVVEFLKTNVEVDSVVSAANAFGIMDGGLDAVYLRHFGLELQEAVQCKISAEYLGEQPIGTSIVVDIPGHAGIKFYHIPSMRVPQPIIDPRVIYTCTRTALVTGILNGAKNMLLPAFGHLTGRVEAEIVSELMYRAYNDVCKNSERPIKPKTCFEETVGLDDILIKHFIYKYE